ncbi:MAG: aminopeptidase [Desulfobacterales bacterium]|jgi:aminopeptidase|nr:aminopeptidase [Desulfobacterales bacterium]
MLTEKQLQRYADVLLWGLHTARNGRIKKNEVVLIRYDMPAIRLAEILYAKLLEMGIHPIQRAGLTPVMEKQFYTSANSKQLVFRVPGDDALYQHLNGSIFLHAPVSITHLADTDPSKIAKATVAKKYLRDILDSREEKGLFSWTLCTLPTAELSRQAGMGIKAYGAQIAKACFLDRKDPVHHWREIHRAAGEIKDRLNRLAIDHFHIESSDVDLTVTPGAKRKWLGISGHNIPSFELFLSPDWHGTHGRYYADQPSYRSGNYVRGVRLEFANGKAVSVRAEVGEAFVNHQLSMDSGACRIGEFSLTDKRFSRINAFMANTLYDENYGGKFGNCHIALGASYSDSFNGAPASLTPELKKKLGFNHSALHWDLVNTQPKRVTAHLKSGGRTVIYENGLFL